MSDPKHWNYLFKATCNTCYHNQCALPEKKDNDWNGHNL